MKEVISVIVPVYNVEAYLEQCIESIVNQTYPNLEIILVDDGSPDKCGEICDAWQKKDARIRVIHQKNGGAGKARNAGLAVAVGDYVSLVDSDDYLHSEMYESLLRHMKDGVDIVECDYYATESDNVFEGKEVQEEKIESYTAQEALRANIRDNFFRQLIWNKLYRRRTVEGIEFPVGKKIDDEFWTYQILGNARKLIKTNKVLYAYRQQEQSVMHLLDANKRAQAIEAKCERHRYVLKNMPGLAEESLQNIWFTCIYQGQLILRTEKDNQEAMRYLEDTLRTYSMDSLPKDISLSHKIWLKMAQKSLKTVCKVRNRLKVGI